MKQKDFQREEYQNDIGRSDSLLDGKELADFKTYTKKLINSSLYTKTITNFDPKTRTVKDVKVFINSEQDVSDSLKMLQTDLVSKLLPDFKGEFKDLTKKELFTALNSKYKNARGSQTYFDYLLILNFDTLVSEFAKVDVKNDSSIYNNEIKYSYNSKLNLVKKLWRFRS